MAKKKHDIRQRTKGEPISIDTDLPLAPVKIGDLQLKDRISLTLKASPEDWAIMYELGVVDPTMLGRLIFLNAVSPVYEGKIKPLLSPPPRGIHALDMGAHADENEEEFMNASRNYVAAAHAVIGYWLNRPEEEWPKSFKEVV
ncbi:MAG: hypothetical protein CVU57_20960 [Deltaproteobacteria bacterium HGW-Deltaproteobacteria-15]|nr:MAG: hypothetical protein CVU57_20960 [Deltaproteobacteria bacterium HGW-Deltaproteobacteria-15]PKN99389.1 MAG: hypothetical protein CVU43_15325 [Chloroflexi bacterium HGW-Chloroflexi-5]